MGELTYRFGFVGSSPPSTWSQARLNRSSTMRRTCRSSHLETLRSAAFRGRFIPFVAKDQGGRGRPNYIDYILYIFTCRVHASHDWDILKVSWSCESLMRSLVTECQLGGKNNCWFLMYLLKVSLSFTIKGFEEQHCRTVQSTIFTSKRGILASYRGTNQQWVMKEKNGDTRQTAKKKGLWLTMRYRTDTPSRFSAKSTKQVSLQIFTVHFAFEMLWLHSGPPAAATAAAPTGSDEGVTVHSAIGDAGLGEKSLVLEHQPSKSTRDPLDTGNPIMSLWSTYKQLWKITMFV